MKQHYSILDRSVERDKNLKSMTCGFPYLFFLNCKCFAFAQFLNQRLIFKNFFIAGVENSACDVKIKLCSPYLASSPNNKFCS